MMVAMTIAEKEKRIRLERRFESDRKNKSERRKIPMGRTIKPSTERRKSFTSHFTTNLRKVAKIETYTSPTRN